MTEYWPLEVIPLPLHNPPPGLPIKLTLPISSHRAISFPANAVSGAIIIAIIESLLKQLLLSVKL